MCFYLRSFWLKVCFCSVETWAEGNPGVCSVSFSHWDSRAGQCLFRLSNTSEKCSVRLRGEPPPTASDGNQNTKKTVLNVRNKLHRVRMMNSFISLTSSMVSIRSFPSLCNTSPSGGMSLQRGSSSVCQGQGKNNKNLWADESTWDQNYRITLDCTCPPRLTKKRLAAFTVGVSGNFSDKIPEENKRERFFF